VTPASEICGNGIDEDCHGADQACADQDAGPEQDAGPDAPATPTLVSIQVDPPTASIVRGAQATFSVTATYDNGSTLDIPATDCTWTSSSPAVATVATGVATGLQTGSAVLTATLGGLSSQASLLVRCAIPTSSEKVSALTFGGENCYGNTVDPGGGDYDDFFVTLTGDMQLEEVATGYRIYSNRAQAIRIRAVVGTWGSSALQGMTVLRVITCEGIEQSTTTLSGSMLSSSLEVAEGDVIDIFSSFWGVPACTGSYSFTHDHDTAFRLIRTAS